MHRHLNQFDRDRIEALIRSGQTQSSIAEVVKVDKSTISRELKRKRKDGRYDAETADHKAYVKRWRAKYQGMKIEKNDDLKAHIIAELKLKRSPDEIAGRMRKDQLPFFASKNAIYKWLYSVYGERYCWLLCTKRKRKKRQRPDKQPRVMIPNLTSIHDASEVFAEGDTFVSPKRYQTTASVAVVVEKSSKLILARKLPSLKPKLMASAVRRFGKQMLIQNVALDRGIENRYHERFGIQTYFCDAQSPYQKPLVEGSIGLMRRWFWKKGTDLSKVSHAEIKKNVNILNNKYRKSLHYRSALEVARERGILRGETNSESCV